MTEPRQPTAEEIAANVAKAQAEAAKATAEATKAEAEARDAVAKARISEVEAEKKEYVRREEQAGDLFHHVYRFDETVTAGTVAKAVNKLTQWHRLDPGCDIEFIINSPGGGVIEGFALFDHLRWMSDEGHKVTTGCTGMAASMGGILIQAGDERWMSKESWYMIHRAAFGAIGKTFEVEDRVKWVKRIEDRIIDIFTSRTTLTKNVIKRNWERQDWWLDSTQCQEKGLVDYLR